jgi:serine/threonine-protein kinase
MAAPFDANSLEVEPAVRVFEWQGRVDGRFGFSPAGTLVYRSVPGDVGDVTFVWVDRKGNEQPLAIPPARYQWPRISPDGQRVAVSSFTGDSTARDLTVFELMRPPANVRLATGGINVGPVWTPDGNRVIYTHADEQTPQDETVLSVSADGNGAPVSLWTGTYRVSSISHPNWILIGTSSVDRPGGREPSGPAGGQGRGPAEGGQIGGRRGGRARGGQPNQLLTLKVMADGTAAGDRATFLDSRYSRNQAEFSPDGRLVAFTSNQNGPTEVFVASFPEGRIVPISSGGGAEPRWNSNGRELFYRSGDMIMVADVATSPTFRVLGTPRVLFEKAAQGYDVHPNGQRFLMLKPVPRDSRPSDLHVILNWFDELRRLAPLPD